MKCSNEALQNLPYMYLEYEKPGSFFFVSHFMIHYFIFSLMNAMHMRLAGLSMYEMTNKKTNYIIRGFLYSKNMENFEAFHWNILSSGKTR